MTSNFVCNDCRGTVCEEAHILPMLNIQGKRSCVKCRIRIEKALENYVCIPKGENRHPYVDEIHAWAEGIAVEWRADESCYWGMSEFDDYQYRIKPSEPIYEWQWYWVEDGIATIANGGKFMTDDEANIDMPIWYKFEQTMKERK